MGEGGRTGNIVVRKVYWWSNGCWKTVWLKPNYGHFCTGLFHGDSVKKKKSRVRWGPAAIMQSECTMPAFLGTSICLHKYQGGNTKHSSPALLSQELPGLPQQQIKILGPGNELTWLRYTLESVNLAKGNPLPVSEWVKNVQSRKHSPAGLPARFISSQCDPAMLQL